MPFIFQLKINFILHNFQVWNYHPLFSTFIFVFAILMCGSEGCIILQKNDEFNCLPCYHHQSRRLICPRRHYHQKCILLDLKTSCVNHLDTSSSKKSGQDCKYQTLFCFQSINYLLAFINWIRSHVILILSKREALKKLSNTWPLFEQRIKHNKKVSLSYIFFFGGVDGRSIQLDSILTKFIIRMLPYLSSVTPCLFSFCSFFSYWRSHQGLSHPCWSHRPQPH